jgi:hypothetical protein
MPNRRTLTVKWQRLLTDGRTCPRCGGTEKEIGKAVETLRRSLDPLGIAVVLEKGELTTVQFAEDTLQSNAIWIGGRLLEDWLSAETGKSECCEVCGPSDCRTLGVGGEVYEVVPAELIVRAGLLAAAQMLGTGECGCAPTEGQPEVCCPGQPPQRGEAAPGQPYTENVLEAPNSEVVCWCSQVTKEILLAAKRQGARTVDDVRATTKACTVGRCKEFNPRGRCCSKEIKLLLEADTDGGVR